MQRRKRSAEWLTPVVFIGAALLIFVVVKVRKKLKKHSLS